MTGTVAAPEVINAYFPLTADAAQGATTVTVGTRIGAAHTLATGDLVMVWRATGVSELDGVSGNQTKRVLSTLRSTPANAVGLVGRYEFARITAVAGNAVTLDAPLLNPYVRNLSQLVWVPEYTTVNVPTGTAVTATPWQEVGGNVLQPNPNAPWAGGILIFFSQGAITNAGLIHANGRGFHGAVPANQLLRLQDVVCSNSPEDGTPAQGKGEKGQGLVHSRYTNQTGGRGNVLNAGGGANCAEGGGGGGGSFGRGGDGQGTILGLGTGGRGGSAVDYSLLERLPLGGGGGSGHHTVGLNVEVSFGGFGGGAVYIRGTVMNGKGRLESSGANGENTGLLGLPGGLASEGSGGGGAGGNIVVRLTGNADCDQVSSTGGNGGDATVVGLPVLGAGGGGGGGKVLFQSGQRTPDCNINVDPGRGGNNGGASGGDPGNNQPPPDGSFCVEGPTGAPGTCADPRPICDTNTGSCTACKGPFGSGVPGSCGVNVEPVCLTAPGPDRGACVPCEDDFGTTNPKACQLSGNPFCRLPGQGASGPVGSCGKCTSNADCTGHSSGPVCNTNSGSCGNTCQVDTDCKPTEWCAPQSPTGGNVCTPKTPNSQPLPPFSPINGECTIDKGNRVCLSAVCEPDDDLCGLQNGKPCSGQNQCRSNICFPTDNLCGLPNGEQCQVNEACRSNQCENGVCVGGCDKDTDCKIGQVCDRPAGSDGGADAGADPGQCVTGCRPAANNLPDGGRAHGACAQGEQCVAPAGAAIGQCQPLNDGGVVGDGGGAGDGGGGGNGLVPLDGLIEGGGCACSSTGSSGSSSFALAGIALGALFVGRRRSKARRK